MGLQLLAMLLEVNILHRGGIVTQESGTVCERMEVLLLRRGLWRGCKEIGDLFDAFREVHFRLFSLSIAIGFCAVEEFRVNV
jgi:hypothetical protein